MAKSIDDVVEFDPKYFGEEMDEKFQLDKEMITRFMFAQFIKPNLNGAWKPVIDLKSISRELLRNTANTFNIFEGLNTDPSLYDFRATIGDYETIERIAEGIKDPRFKDHLNFNPKDAVNEEYPFPGVYIFFPLPLPGNTTLMRNHYGAEYQGNERTIERFALPQEMVITPEIDAAVWNAVKDDRRASKFIPMNGPRKDKNGRNIPDTLETRLSLVDDKYKDRIVFFYMVSKRDPDGNLYSSSNLEPVTEIIRDLEIERKMSGSGTDKLAEGVNGVASQGVEAAVSLSKDLTSGKKTISEETKKRLEAYSNSVVDLTQVYMNFNGDLEPYIQSASELGRAAIKRQLAGIKGLDERSKEHIRKILNLGNQKLLLGIATIFHLGEKYPELRKSNPILEGAISYNLGELSLIGMQEENPGVLFKRILGHPEDTSRIIRDTKILDSRTDVDPELVYKLIEMSHTDKHGFNSLRIGNVSLDLRPDFKVPLRGDYGKIYQIGSLIEGVLMVTDGMYSEFLPDYLFQNGKKLSPFKAMDKISRANNFDADVIRAFAEVSGLFPTGTMLRIKLRDNGAQALLWYTPDGNPRHFRAIEPTKLNVGEFYSLVNSEGQAIPYQKESSSQGENKLTQLTSLGNVKVHSIFLYPNKDSMTGFMNNGKFNREAFDYVIVEKLVQERAINGY